MNTLVLSLVLVAPAQSPVQVEVPPTTESPAPKKEAPLPSDLLTAAMLIDSPCNTPVPPYGDYWKKIRDAIHVVAVEREIMDPRECRYFMAEIGDFENDLNLLRTRNEQLRNAPKLADVNRLPDRRTINDLISFNREFKKHLEERLSWESDRADILTVAIKDCDKCYRAWDALRDARCDFYYVTVRRLNLAKYRAIVGDEDYMAGKMHDYVPDWAFVRR